MPGLVLILVSGYGLGGLYPLSLRERAGVRGIWLKRELLP